MNMSKEQVKTLPPVERSEAMQARAASRVAEANQKIQKAEERIHAAES